MTLAKLSTSCFTEGQLQERRSNLHLVECHSTHVHVIWISWLIIYFLTIKAFIRTAHQWPASVKQWWNLRRWHWAGMFHTRGCSAGRWVVYSLSPIWQFCRRTATRLTTLQSLISDNPPRYTVSWARHAVWTGVIAGTVEHWTDWYCLRLSARDQSRILTQPHNTG